MKKAKTLNIRITIEKYNELQMWADRFQIKLGPFCLFILMEKIENYNAFLDISKQLKLLDITKDDKNEFEI